MKHVEIAKKWLNGEVVQVRTPTGWVDLEPQEKFQGFNNLFYDLFEYRVKPVVRYVYSFVYANPSNLGVGVLGYNTLADIKRSGDGFNYSHILKVGDDGSAELLPRIDI